MLQKQITETKNRLLIFTLDTSGGRTAERQEVIAERLKISRQTVNNVRHDFLTVKNLTIFLQRKKRETPPVPPKITGELEARIISLACGEAPKGAARMEDVLACLFPSFKHGSWLNIAEIELSAMAVQCLGQRRIPCIKSLNEELAAWHTQRNLSQKGVDRQLPRTLCEVRAYTIFFSLYLHKLIKYIVYYPFGNTIFIIA